MPTAKMKMPRSYPGGIQTDIGDRTVWDAVVDYTHLALPDRVCQDFARYLTELPKLQNSCFGS